MLQRKHKDPGENVSINAMLYTRVGPDAAAMLHEGGVAEIRYLLASQCHHPHRLTA